MQSVRLFILDAFDRHGEMHGHQLRAYADRERVPLWTDISVGSLYQVMKRLRTEGLLAPLRYERSGNYPERQIFAITDAGRASLTKLRRQGLLDVSGRTDPFDLALTRAGSAGESAIKAAVAARLVKLYKMTADRSVLDRGARPYLTPLELRALGHRAHMLRADITWHEALLESLPEMDPTVAVDLGLAED